VDMRGYAHADIPCPGCGTAPNAIVYVRGSMATLFCQECYQSWTLERASHPSLANLTDSMPPMKDEDRLRWRR
jgi:hypothetical protein